MEYKNSMEYKNTFNAYVYAVAVNLGEIFINVASKRECIGLTHIEAK